MRSLTLAVLIVTLLFDGVPSWHENAEAADGGLQFFEAKIRPVLVEQCYSCHSENAKSVKSQFELDTRTGIRRGGEIDVGIVIGDAAASPLIRALEYDDLEMPPSGRLSQATIDDFRKWIDMGAPDPRDSKGPDNAQRAPRDSSQFWSLQPVQRPIVPDVEHSTWTRNAIDSFILNRLSAASLSPVADAKPTTLVRRMVFDLTGLPPTQSQTEAFLRAYRRDEQQAITQLADTLLSSAQFGETWGRLWLDLVRYAESNGGDRDVVYPHAWRYRNYVIAAFNTDKPYDRFLREQLAGDLLPAASVEQRDEQLVATGMLTLGVKLFMETDSEQFRMDRVDEQMDVVTRGFIGLTVSCARCHDHKFDPIPTRDYYALAGVFRSTHLLYGPAAPEGNQYGHDRPLQPIGPGAEQLQGPAEKWQAEVADKTAARNKARSDRYRVVRQRNAHETELKSANETKSQELKLEIEQLSKVITEWDAKIDQLDAELKLKLDNPPPQPDYCMAVRDADQVEDCQLRIRGICSERGEMVPRGFIAAISNISSPSIATGHSGRRELAEWITDPQHPLTARVIVNRIWQQLFGEGIVKSVDNFGEMGDRPSHPELLDYLATELTENQWSLKRLIRMIVLSRTYRLSSRSTGNQLGEQIDPDNHLLWRQNSKQLRAEELRDAIRTLAGELNFNQSLGSALADLKAPELNDTVRLTAEQLESTHRSIYLPVARFQLPEMLETFGFPDSCLPTGRRETKTMVSQQLFMLNSPWVHQQARTAASRFASNDDSGTRIADDFSRFFVRQATPEELERCAQFLNDEQCHATQAGQSKPLLNAWTVMYQAWMASAEFRTLE